MISARKSRSQGFTLSWLLLGVEFLESCLFLFVTVTVYFLLLSFVLMFVYSVIESNAMLQLLPVWLWIIGTGSVAIVCFGLPYLMLRVLWPVRPPFTK